MGWPIRRTLAGLATIAFVGALVAGASAAGGGPLGDCGSFASQAQAQDRFLAAGGEPGRNAGGLDPDRDGVACEELGAPYKGYATIGYNRARHFFYGTAALPVGPDGARCLYGNRYDLDSARRLNVFRVAGGGDRPQLADLPGTNAAAEPQSARLVWKAPKRKLQPGLYYVEFEAAIKAGPYGGSECPAFASRPRPLPRP